MESCLGTPALECSVPDRDRALAENQNVYENNEF